MGSSRLRRDDLSEGQPCCDGCDLSRLIVLLTHPDGRIAQIAKTPDVITKRVVSLALDTLIVIETVPAAATAPRLSRPSQNVVSTQTPDSSSHKPRLRCDPAPIGSSRVRRSSSTLSEREVGSAELHDQFVDLFTPTDCRNYFASAGYGAT